ncbi:hypothetical protein [Cynomolgus macaque cytomegalovirus strain Mauritius]|uniref:Uncharacterized protein n=1 Tax=Cynomolgus macaque cytomegalovirus strain Mauritius TaxID=1690255 RepID=A0A0K1H064_9BETA|nr:hypothetical protein [Cynomolgus macaque cytomegalovirus strain Mauritius]AXG21820.1 hypothetical protein [synthetic construct]AXG22087.1 hypothetical protein [synthetic construct]
MSVLTGVMMSSHAAFCPCRLATEFFSDMLPKVNMEMVSVSRNCGLSTPAAWRIQRSTSSCRCTCMGKTRNRFCTRTPMSLRERLRYATQVAEVYPRPMSTVLMF